MEKNPDNFFRTYEYPRIILRRLVEEDSSSQLSHPSSYERCETKRSRSGEQDYILLTDSKSKRSLDEPVLPRTLTDNEISKLVRTNRNAKPTRIIKACKTYKGIDYFVVWNEDDNLELGIHKTSYIEYIKNNYPNVLISFYEHLIEWEKSEDSAKKIATPTNKDTLSEDIISISSDETPNSD